MSLLPNLAGLSLAPPEVVDIGMKEEQACGRPAGLGKRPCRDDVDDGMKLWKLSNDFCREWKNDTDALGARNVLAVFYLLAKCAQNGLDTFPDNDNWFNFVGRFLALYVRDRNSAGKAVDLSDSVKTLVKEKIEGVTVETLQTANGVEQWVKTINDACRHNTKDKIDELVGVEHLNNPQMQLVVMAAEFTKGDWVTPWKGVTIAETPFYGTGKDSEVGRCNMMNHSSKSNVFLWQGEYCQVVLMPTAEPDRPRDLSDVYGLVVLPFGKQRKPTELGMMDRATTEVAENLAQIKGAIKFKSDTRWGGSRTPDYDDDVVLQLPRMRHTMRPFDLSTACQSVLPFELMHSINNVAVVKDDVTGWGPSPPLRVDKVLHSTFLQVHEAGFEAAAATAVAVYVLSSAAFGQPPPPRLVRCDRGFLFYIANLGPQPHVLYYSRVTNDIGLRDAPQASDPDKELHSPLLQAPGGYETLQEQEERLGADPYSAHRRGSCYERDGDEVSIYRRASPSRG